MQTSNTPIHSSPSPYPYPPPMYGISYPIRTSTELGLKYFTIALLLFVILFFTGVLLFSLAFFGLSETGIVIVILAIFLPLAIVILFIVGIAFMNSGKFEFGPKHVNNVKKANIFTILVVVFMVLSMMLPIALIYTSYSPSFTSFVINILFLIFYTIFHISFVLALIYFIKEIINDKYKKILYLPLIIILSVSILYVPSMYYSSISNIISPIVMIIYLVVLFMLFIFYRSTFLRVRARLIQPLSFPPPPPVYPMYPYPYPGHPGLTPVPQPYQKQRSYDKIMVHK